MLQWVTDKFVYVIDLPDLATVALPVTGLGYEAPYAEALTHAITRKIITKSGKYGVEVDFPTNKWKIYEIT